tara:strand:+ start:123 stop:374 length:252 start_codon:yes stop_codon:yes gene_type:complete
MPFTDEEILRGFFFHSRYITNKVFNKYGLNPNLYKDLSSQKTFLLKEKIKQLLLKNEFKEVNNEEELHNLLGNEFDWVKSFIT